MEANAFSEGDIVWARLKGSPWWPAKVRSFKDLPDLLKHKQKSGKICYPVYFYGTHNYQVLKEGNIQSFNKENHEKLENASSSARFKKALEEATSLGGDKEAPQSGNLLQKRVLKPSPKASPQLKNPLDEKNPKKKVRNTDTDNLYTEEKGKKKKNLDEGKGEIKDGKNMVDVTSSVIDREQIQAYNAKLKMLCFRKNIGKKALESINGIVEHLLDGEADSNVVNEIGIKNQIEKIQKLNMGTEENLCVSIKAKRLLNKWQKCLPEIDKQQGTKKRERRKRL